MEGRGWRLHWDRLKDDLHGLEEITVRNPAKTFVMRSRTRGDAGKAIQAVDVALGPTPPRRGSARQKSRGHRKIGRRTKRSAKNNAENHNYPLRKNLQNRGVEE